MLSTSSPPSAPRPGARGPDACRRCAPPGKFRARSPPPPRAGAAPRDRPGHPRCAGALARAPQNPQVGAPDPLAAAAFQHLRLEHVPRPLQGFGGRAVARVQQHAARDGKPVTAQQGFPVDLGQAHNATPRLAPPRRSSLRTLVSRSEFVSSRAPACTNVGNNNSRSDPGVALRLTFL